MLEHQTRKHKIRKNKKLSTGNIFQSASVLQQNTPILAFRKKSTKSSSNKAEIKQAHQLRIGKQITKAKNPNFKAMKQCQLWKNTSLCCNAGRRERSERCSQSHAIFLIRRETRRYWVSVIWKNWERKSREHYKCRGSRKSAAFYWENWGPRKKQIEGDTYYCRFIGNNFFNWKND